MTSFRERYQQGFYQEVYNDLMALGEHVFDDPYIEDARSVASLLMKRVRHNLEVILLPRLHIMGYRFGDGSWEHPDMLTDEELSRVQLAEPIFQAPTKDVAIQLARLQELTGTLPLSLVAWYMEVGAINLIGSFPLSSSPSKKAVHGYGLDPLFTESLVNTIEDLSDYFEHKNNEEETIMMPISPDGDLKYGYSGSGDYEIAVPCKAFDGFLLDEPHHTTFINYLRICLRWGGFPGLENWTHFPQENLRFLTQDLLPF